jgi:hypothetical protein
MSADRPGSTEAPLIDVVIPTYGPVPYLGHALRSVRAQTYAHWRLTVVDNSPERGEVAALLAEHLGGDPRVRLLATGGLGQAENWNAALRSGDAPYIAMLHDDDEWEDTFLAARVRVLEEHEGCAFVFSGYRQIDTQGVEIGIRPLRVAPGVLEPRTFVPVQYVANVVPPCAILYRRTAIDAMDHAFDPSAPFFDYEFWLRLGSRMPVYALDELDYRLRIHEASVTSALFGSSERHTGQLWLDFLDIVEPAIEEALPGLLSPSVRRRRRASALLTAALDELQVGQRRPAARGSPRPCGSAPRPWWTSACPRSSCSSWWDRWGAGCCRRSAGRSTGSRCPPTPATSGSSSGSGGGRGGWAALRPLARAPCCPWHPTPRSRLSRDEPRGVSAGPVGRRPGWERRCRAAHGASRSPGA